MVILITLIVIGLVACLVIFCWPYIAPRIELGGTQTTGTTTATTEVSNATSTSSSSTHTSTNHTSRGSWIVLVAFALLFGLLILAYFVPSVGETIEKAGAGFADFIQSALTNLGWVLLATILLWVLYFGLSKGSKPEALYWLAVGTSVWLLWLMIFGPDITKTGETFRNWLNGSSTSSSSRPARVYGHGDVIRLRPYGRYNVVITGEVEVHTPVGFFARFYDKVRIVEDRGRRMWVKPCRPGRFHTTVAALRIGTPSVPGSGPC